MYNMKRVKQKQMTLMYPVFYPDLSNTNANDCTNFNRSLRKSNFFSSDPQGMSVSKLRELNSNRSTTMKLRYSINPMVEHAMNIICSVLPHTTISNTNMSSGFSSQRYPYR